jgi:hypothetical protein
MVEGRSEVIIIVTAFCVGLPLITVCLRCYVRIWIVRAFGWDDRLMVVAMVSFPSDRLQDIYVDLKLSLLIRSSILGLRCAGLSALATE